MSLLIGGATYAVSAPMSDFSDYQAPVVDRYAPLVTLRDGEFRLISHGLRGGVYERSLRNGFALPERVIDAAPGALAYVPGGFVSIFEQAVHSPAIAGARRLYYRFVPDPVN